MSRLSRIMDELINRIPRRLSGRAMWRCLERKPHRTIRNIGREVEELESRDVPSLLGQQLFPSNYPINQNIANAPVATNSAAIISHIGTSIKVHPDLGYDGQNPAYASGPLYGIPFNVVHGNSVSKVNVIIDGYPSESDILPVPIPANAVIGGDYQDGPNLNGPGYNSGQRGDSQLIIWDEDNNIAYELFGASRPNDVTNTTGQWEATSETVWYMNTDQFRTLGETSADAAGDSILAGLLRPDEALPVSQGGQGAIDHALRFTLPSQDINPQYIYPASHEINVSSQSSTSLPLGARLRLENTPAVDALIAKMGPEAQIAATAMQQYGLILADDGSSMYVTGSSASVDANNNISLTWDVNDILGLESLTAGDFQVVNLTPIVTGLSESSGAAGNTVTITGQNFSGAAGNLSVFFGTTAATSVTFVSDTEITAVVPSGSGTVNVTVQSGIVESGSNSSSNATSPVFGYGTSTTLSADQFTYGSGQTISGSNSTVSFASSSDVSGSGDIVTIVVEDTTGKAVSGLANSVFVLSLSGGKSTGTFGTVTETSTPGTYTTTFTGSTAGTAGALTATVGGVQLNNQPTVQVTPGAVNASKSTVSFASSTDASGTNDVATIVVEDASGNAITGLANSAFAFSLTGGTGTGTFGNVTETSTLGTYTASFTGVLAGTADTLALKVNTVALTGQPKVTVTPGSVGGGNSSVSFSSSTVTSGQTDTVTIVVKDAAGNAITGLANSAFAFSLGSGTSTGTFGTVTETATHGTYTATFTGVLSGTASTLTATVSGVQLTSQPQVTVTVGSVSGTKSTVSFASGTDQSGTSDTATIVVEDAAGNAITGLASSAFAFSLGSGTSTGTFGTVTETATHGTYTASFTGTTAGTASTLTLKVNSVQLTSQPQVTVTVGGVSGTKSTVSFASGTDQSGASDTATIVVEDAAGNPITGLASSAFAFSLGSGTSTGTFGTVTETATHGTYTASFTGATAGTASTLTLKVNSVQLTSQPQVTVTTSNVSGTKSTVSFASGTDQSGSSDTATIVVEDASGNPITGLASSAFAFSLGSGTSTGTFGTVTETATHGTYTATFTGVLAGTASTLTATVSGVQLTSQPQVTVTVGAVSGTKSTVSFASGTDQSGTSDTATIVVEDAAGNAITGLASSAFAFSLGSGTSTGTFGTVTETATHGTYTASFTGALAGTADTTTLKVNSVQLTSQPQVTVTPGAVSGAKSTVSFASGTDQSGTSDTATIVVEDAAGNPITGLASSAFTFSLAGGTSTGTFGTVTETATHGTYTASFTGSTAGTASTLTLKVNSVQLTSQPQVTVTVGGVSGTKSTVSFASGTDQSGTSDTATIVVEDAAGNAITGLASSAFAFSLASGTSTGTFGTVTETATHGTYTASFTGSTAGTASTLTLKVNSVQLTSQPQVTVTTSNVSGTKSTVSFASGTDQSGTSDTATIVVEDAAGNPITGLASSAFAFSLAGGTSTGTFGTVTETATHGTYTASFTGALAGTADTTTLKVNSVQLTSQPQVTVTPGAISSVNSTSNFTSGTVTSGQNDSVTVVVTDAAGNAISGLPSSDFSFSLSGGTSTGTFGAVTQTSTPGTYTGMFTGVLAGTTSDLTTVIDGIKLDDPPGVEVMAGSVNGGNSSVSFASSSVNSGSTETVTIMAKDAAGNAITGLTSSAFSFGLAGGTSTGTFGTVVETSTPGTYTTIFTGVTVGTASSLALTVSGAQLTAQPQVTVTTPVAISGTKSTVSFAATTVASGKTDLVTIVVKDVNGKAVTNLASGDFVFNLSGGKSTGSFGTVAATATAGTYTAEFTGVIAGTASTLTLQINGTQVATQPKVTVKVGVVSGGNSTVSLAAPTVASGKTDKLTIVVEDAAGNPFGGLASSAFVLSLSGGASTGTFSAVTATTTAGTYTATFTGVIAGTASNVNLKVGAAVLTTHPAVQVTPGVVGGGRSTMTVATASVASGTTDLVTIAVKDPAQNVISGLPSSAFVFSFAGGKSTATLGTVTETSTPGTYTVLLTGVTAGTASTLTVKIEGVLLTNQPKVTVKAGAVSAAVSAVSFASPTVATGLTDKLTLTVKDAAGNAIGGLTNSAFLFVLSGGASTGTFGTVAATTTPGVYAVLFKGGTVGTTSTLTVEVDGITLTTQPTIQVT